MRRGAEEVEFALPDRLEKLLAALSAYYATQKKLLLQRVVVNATCKVQEGWDYDNWDGGTWGHLVQLKVPSAVFYEAFDSKTEVEEAVAKDLNRLEDVPSEYVAKVVLQLGDDLASEGWREKSGLLVRGAAAPAVSEDRVSHLWEPGFLRVFLSHTSKYKKQTAALKASLGYYGASSFVAHEDIHPTREWQSEIELALFSMEVMVPLLTDGFKESNWADQEVGVAIGRGIPVVPVRLGKDPYGFIGKYQAVARHGKRPKVVADKLMDVFLGNPNLKARATQALVRRFEEAEDFDHANTLMDWLDKIEMATPELIERLEKAPQGNRQIAEAWRVRERLPSLLKRLKGGKR